jgi:hypothetical protein
MQLQVKVGDQGLGSGIHGKIRHGVAQSFQLKVS